MKNIIKIEHEALESAAECSYSKLSEIWVQLRKDIDEGNHIRVNVKSSRIIGHGFKDIYDNTTLNLFISKFENEFHFIIGSKPN
ncbi:hypothetical protein [Aquirufa aurantiipilula]|uniref:hypothetical protein n=1 Tax=Aquirufa aurantiipilula TaxID=2696561 RepID=UPI001CAA6B87|nr:hypothetical protein [Aquirufa aurantiipilula]MBZ1327007.1 hypothetical protein [Aquirufa aurantiipilula]